MKKVVNIQELRIKKQYMEYYSNRINLKNDTKYFNSRFEIHRMNDNRLALVK